MAAVVRLGVLADLMPPEADADPLREFSIGLEQYAELSDGRRVVYDERHGYSSGVGVYAKASDELPSPPDVWTLMTREMVEHDIANVLLPDDDDDPEARPWEHLAAQIRACGVATTAEHLRALPLEIVFSERLAERLPETG
jgi:hypothetical protein